MNPQQKTMITVLVLTIVAFVVTMYIGLPTMVQASKPTARFHSNDRFASVCYDSTATSYIYEVKENSHTQWRATK
jgi:hypothetical protein